MAKGPFCGPLFEGDVDPRVEAYKRTVSRASGGDYRWRGLKFTRKFGPVLADAVRKVQRHAGLDATGSIGRNTHNALMAARTRKGEPACDGLSAKILRDACAELAETSLERKVEAGLKCARLYVAHSSEIEYTQMRPMQLRRIPHLPSRGDCSASCAMIYFNADLPDPNGRDYDGGGYTGTLLAHGREVSLGSLQPLDLVFYGSTTVARPGFPVGAPTHVACSMGDSQRDRVFTFGQDPGPFFQRVEYREPTFVRRCIDDL
jgi:Putative peptidoglycan binding domain